MTSDKLGKLEKCAFSDVWANERGFSKWLASACGLALLGDTLGMELKDAKCEVQVGSFWADVVCTDANDESHRVVIENQRNYTDHSHLGQLQTYGASLEATTLVWIAEEFREEHQMTLDKLNKKSDGMYLFGLEIEVWRIGDSKPAPKFNIVSKPKDWSHSAKPISKGEWSPYAKKQFDFWDKLRDHLINTGINPNPPKARASLVWKFGMGRKGAQGAFVSRDMQNNLGVKIFLWRKPFKFLFEERREIEKELNLDIFWHKATDQENWYSVGCVWEGDWQNEAEWDTFHARMGEAFVKLDKVFRPRIAALKPYTWDDDEYEAP